MFLELVHYAKRTQHHEVSQESVTVKTVPLYASDRLLFGSLDVAMFCVYRHAAHRNEFSALQFNNVAKGIAGS